MHRRPAWVHITVVSLNLLVAQQIAAAPRHHPKIRPTSISPWTLVTPSAAFSPRDTANTAVFLGKMWLSSGYPEGISDLWSSTDGADWQKELDAAPYDVYSHLAVYDGKMWAIEQSVWSSSDGLNWQEVLRYAPFYGLNDVVVFNNKMWVFSDAQIYSTTNGFEWTLEVSSAPYGIRAAPAIAVSDGKIWLLGGSTPNPGKGFSDPNGLGYPDIDMNNDVWSSADGVNWTLVSPHAPWIGRMWFGAQSYAGRLWIMGGYDNDAYQNLGDTWWTTDGINWQQEPLSSPTWSPRHFPSTIVFDDSLWIAAGNSWPVQNDVWKLTATTLVHTTTSLSASLAPATYGQSVTLIATISPSDATGTVSFKDGSTLLDTVDAANGTATLITEALGPGVHTITVSYDGDEDHIGSSDSISVELFQPPTASLTFAATAIPLHGATTLTLQLTNPNAGSALSGVGFSVTLPAGLTIATPNGLTGSCGTGTITAESGSSTILLSGGSLEVSGTCSIAADLTGTSAGTKDVATTSISSVEGGNGNPAERSLDVLAPPSMEMAFGDAAMPLHGTTSLSFTITNPSDNALALSEVGFDDPLPAGIAVASPNGLTGVCGGGTITAGEGSTHVNLSGATLAAHASCAFSVDVLGLTEGSYNNVSGPVASVNGGTGNAASASISVKGADLSISKAHSGNFTQSDVGRTYTITVRNVGLAASSGLITVVDNLPNGLTASDISGAGWTCTLSSLTCTRADAVQPSTSAPAIVVTVNVSAIATNLTNTVTVDGGDDHNAANNTAADFTIINSAALVAPTGLVATASSNSQVNLAWNATLNADSYQIFRGTGQSPFLLVGSSAATAFNDSGLAPDTTYLYQVRAVGGGGDPGPFSAMDFATTIVFSDDPIVPGTTLIRAVHLTEINTAINALREAAGLPPVDFSDAAVPGGLIAASYLIELRQSLNAARSALGVLPMSFTDPMLGPGDTVRAIHIQELRAGVE